MIDIQRRVSAQSDFESMARALVTALQTALRASRVSIAWLSETRTALAPELTASSSGSRESIASELRRSLVAAMDEAIIQQHSLSSTDALNSGRISAAQRALAELTASCVITVPLAMDNRAIGAVCVELPAGAIPPGDVLARRRLKKSIEFLEAVLPPCARLIGLARQANPDIPTLIRQRLGRRVAADRSARTRRRVWTGVLVVLLAVLLVPFEQPITNPARLEGAIEREIAAPIDGFVESVAVRPGDLVAAGQVLLSLSRRELEIEAGQLQAELEQHQAGANAAMSAGDRAAMAESQARANQVKARLALIEIQLEQTSIRSPLAGTVLQGDLTERENTPVDRGEVLMKIAPDQKLRVIIEVAENDIAHVRDRQEGELALSALPWERFALRVERIAPIATVVDNRNVVEVLASLAEQPANIKPGQRGVVHLAYKRQNLLTRWAGNLLDSLARAWWRWQPW